MLNAKCKICRRAGVKLFLRGERCYSPKCAMVKRPYAPGNKGKRRRGRGKSEYGQELAEKQKLKNWYGLSERQFKKYVRESLRAKDATASLLSRLESRLDNIVFRLGLVSSRKLARQLVNHGFFLVNNKSSWAPSRALKKGDQIKLKPEKTKKKILASFLVNLKRQKLPAWLKFDEAHFEAEVVETPTIAASDLPAEASAIFEFYSR